MCVVEMGVSFFLSPLSLTNDFSSSFPFWSAFSESLFSVSALFGSESRVPGDRKS